MTKACMFGLQTAAAADPSQVNVAAQVGVQAADLTDKLLQRFCTEHQEPGVVQAIDLHNCSQIGNIECLGVFRQLCKLELEGCHKVEVSSLAAVLKACSQLRVDVGEFLRTHGRVEEALDYYKKDLAIARQTGEWRPIRSQHLLVR